MPVRWHAGGTLVVLQAGNAVPEQSWLLLVLVKLQRTHFDHSLTHNHSLLNKLGAAAVAVRGRPPGPPADL